MHCKVGVPQVRLQDESMVVCGDLADSFRFDIFAH